MKYEVSSVVVGKTYTETVEADSPTKAAEVFVETFYDWHETWVRDFDDGWDVTVTVGKDSFRVWREEETFDRSLIKPEHRSKYPADAQFVATRFRAFKKGKQ